MKMLKLTSAFMLNPGTKSYPTIFPKDFDMNERFCTILKVDDLFPILPIKEKYFEEGPKSKKKRTKKVYSYRIPRRIFYLFAC